MISKEVSASEVETPLVGSAPSVLIYPKSQDGEVLPWEGDGEGIVSAKISFQVHALGVEPGPYSPPTGVHFWTAKQHKSAEFGAIINAFPGIMNLGVDQQVAAKAFVGIETRTYRVGAYLPGHDKPVAYKDTSLKPGQMLGIVIPPYVKAHLCPTQAAKRVIGEPGVDSGIRLSDDNQGSLVWNDGTAFEGGFAFWLALGHEYSGWFIANTRVRENVTGWPLKSIRVSSKHQASFPIYFELDSAKPIAIPP